MKDLIRTAVAYIAQRLTNSSAPQAGLVFSHATGRQVQFSGTVTTHLISIFDHANGAHITGSPQGIYHFGENGHISLKMDGHSFTGFDFSTGSHFSGSVAFGSVSLFDYAEGRHFQYSVS